jgi:hypothetical protein
MNVAKKMIKTGTKALWLDLSFAHETKREINFSGGAEYGSGDTLV